MSQSLTFRFSPAEADWHLRNSPRRNKSKVCDLCARGNHSRHGEICCLETVAPEPRDHVCACKEGIVVSKYDLPKPVKRLTITRPRADEADRDEVTL